MMDDLLPCPFCGNSVAPRICDENELATCDCKSDNPYYAVVCIINEPKIPTPNWENGCGASGGFAKTTYEAITLWNIRQERAIKAEAEVERLKPIEEFADKNFKLWENAAYTMNAKLRAEIAKLRNVADAARRVMDAVMAQPQDVVERNIALTWLDAALAELDKEGER